MAIMGNIVIKQKKRELGFKAFIFAQQRELLNAMRKLKLAVKTQNTFNADSVCFIKKKRV